MYGALWRRLPGPWPIKLIESLVLVTGVTALMFVVVFPWLEPRLPFTDVVVDEEGADTVDSDNPTGPATPSPGGPASTDAPVLGG